MRSLCNNGGSFTTTCALLLVAVVIFPRRSLAFHLQHVRTPSSSCSHGPMSMSTTGGWGGLGELFDSITKLGNTNVNVENGNGAVLSAKSRVKLGDLSVSPMGEWMPCLARTASARSKHDAMTINSTLRHTIRNTVHPPRIHSGPLTWRETMS